MEGLLAHLALNTENARQLARCRERAANYFAEIDAVAFDQDELYDLLDEGREEIYLCGDSLASVAVENVKVMGKAAKGVSNMAKAAVNSLQKGFRTLKEKAKSTKKRLFG